MILECCKFATTSKEGAFLSPLLFLYMEKLSEKIAVWVAPKLEELDCFLVDIKINPAGSKIEVYIDRDAGLQIETCEQVSRFLELHLDNEAGVPPKYILEVSSPGMDNPFKVERQYLKNIGKTVEVLLTNGVKIEGMLEQYQPDALVLKQTIPPAKKGQAPTYKEATINMNDIKYTKKKISF